MSDPQPTITIMASGRGSNFCAIADAVESGQLNVKIQSLICNESDAPVLKIADQKKIKTHLIPHKGLSREQHESQILNAMESEGFSKFLVMAGYMRKVTPALLKPFASSDGYYRVTNIHPSLLPAFPGIRSYEKAFQYGSAVTGVTVHLVDEQVDHGPICDQRSFSIKGLRSAEEVETKGLEIENQFYPEVLSWVLVEKFYLMDRRFGDSMRRICVRKS